MSGPHTGREVDEPGRGVVPVEGPTRPAVRRGPEGAVTRDVWTRVLRDTGETVNATFQESESSTPAVPGSIARVVPVVGVSVPAGTLVPVARRWEVSPGPPAPPAGRPLVPLPARHAAPPGGRRGSVRAEGSGPGQECPTPDGVPPFWVLLFLAPGWTGVDVSAPGPLPVLVPVPGSRRTPLRGTPVLPGRPVVGGRVPSRRPSLVLLR